MTRRVLSNGVVISRVRCPQSPSHHLYFVDGGSEGQLLVLDTYLINAPIVAAVLAWELDSDKLDTPEPRLEFNMGV